MHVVLSRIHVGQCQDASMKLTMGWGLCESSMTWSVLKLSSGSGTLMSKSLDLDQCI